MTFKKFITRTFSAVIALAMTLATLTPSIIAVDDETSGGKETINYVSLGDSMTNGLGHDGYWKDGYLEEAPVTYPAKLAAYLAGVTDSSDFTENADGTVTFNGDKATVNWAQLATSGARAEDIRFMLEYGSENAYPGDAWTYTQLLGQVSIGASGEWLNGSERWGKNGVPYADYVTMFQESIKNADLITYAAGNANFGVFLSDMLTQVVSSGGYGLDYSYATLENALLLGSADEAMKSFILETYEMVMAELEAILPHELLRPAADKVAYAVASYILSSAATIDGIIAVNPDVEIIVVGIMNNMSNFKFDAIIDGEAVTIDISTVMRNLAAPMSAALVAYIAANEVAGNYPEATFYYAEAEEVESWADDFGELYKDFRYNASAPDFGYPELRYWCHTRFLGNIAKDILPMIVGKDVSGEINADDVKAYEIAKARGEYALYEYVKANPTKAEYISAYLGVVDAILGSIGSKPVVDVDALEIEGEDDIEPALNRVVDGLVKRFNTNVTDGENALYRMLMLDVVRVECGMAENSSDSNAMVKYTSLSAAEKAEMDKLAKQFARIYSMADAFVGACESDGTVEALLIFYGRAQLANGLSSHPGVNGHMQLAEAVITAYATDYFVRSQAINNVSLLINMFGVVLDGNRDAIYQAIYDYAGKRGTAIYLPQEDSFYTAIGGEEYADAVAAALGIEYGALGELRACDIRALLDPTFSNDAYGEAIFEANPELAAKYVEAFTKADLITLDFGTEDLAGFVINQVTGKLLDTYSPIIEYFIKRGLLKSAPAVESYEMDWKRFDDIMDGETIEATIALMREKVLIAGIPEEYTYNIEFVQNIGGKDLVITYAIDLYPADIATYLVESYLYAVLNYVSNYTAAIEAIQAVNPDAEILVIGSINPLADFELVVQGVGVADLAAALVEVLDAQALASVITLPNTTFVSVKNADTKFDTSDFGALIDMENMKVNAGLFGASAEGNEHIIEQILATLILECEHEFDNACDNVCNFCRTTREVPPHQYGEWATTVEPTVEAEGVKERACVVCGHTESEALAKLDPVIEGEVNDNTPDTENPESPATVIIIAVVAAVAVVGTVACLIVIKKKKADK